ncbi:protein kinase [Streptomyces sp. NPDC050264]|uniref:serine/threonine-protein kinase n=1 Tax=Streptomyces sp. NPDC050264 TaxID=3155038 RepID=UPI003427A8EE
MRYEEQQLIVDRYRLEEQLGRGGMGTVWRAWDELLQRMVAVKELHLPGDGTEHAELLSRVLREARAIARVSHPHVIEIFDLVDHAGLLWIVMGYVDGLSLADHLATAGRIPPHQVAKIGREVVSALDAVHAVGALHRDVKPANILLRRDGSAVLTDFGIAALREGSVHTAAGGVLGSAEYMAPERLHSRPAGPASDLFSLGATLCTLLDGQSPFARDNAAATLHAVAFEPPELALPASPLRDVLTGLLEKEPERRPTAEQVVRALDSVAVSEPLSPTLRQPRSELRRRRRTSPRWGAVALVLCVVVAGGITAYKVGGGPSGDEQAGVSAAQVDAVMAAPDGAGRYWLFSGDRYTKVRVEDGKGSRLSKAAALTGWEKSFGGLPRFTQGIDAVMQTPDDKNRYWVFSGDQYVLIEVANGGRAGGRLSGPESLKSWKSFGDLPNFSHRIDAVMQSPDNANHYWLFSGNQYIVVAVSEATHTDTLLAGPSPLKNWKKSFGGLPRFSQRIDATLQDPADVHRYWVFSGDQYITIEVAEGRRAQGRISGPEKLEEWMVV